MAQKTYPEQLPVDSTGIKMMGVITFNTLTNAFEILAPAAGERVLIGNEPAAALLTVVSQTTGFGFSAAQLLTDIKAALQLIDNAISGNEMQVDILSSVLPTGAATQTTLAAVLAALQGTVAVGDATAQARLLTIQNDLDNLEGKAATQDTLELVRSILAGRLPPAIGPQTLVNSLSLVPASDMYDTESISREWGAVPTGGAPQTVWSSTSRCRIDALWLQSNDPDNIRIQVQKYLGPNGTNPVYFNYPTTTGATISGNMDAKKVYDAGWRTAYWELLRYDATNSVYIINAHSWFSLPYGGIVTITNTAGSTSYNASVWGNVTLGVV